MRSPLDRPDRGATSPPRAFFEAMLQMRRIEDSSERFLASIPQTLTVSLSADQAFERSGRFVSAAMSSDDESVSSADAAGGETNQDPEQNHSRSSATAEIFALFHTRNSDCPLS